MKADYKKIADYVYGYKTKHKEGFIKKEITAILYELNINEKRFYEALGVNTCMMIGKDIITYHTDIVKGLVCAIENRQQNALEWD
jgi:hypothetical protein